MRKKFKEWRENKSEFWGKVRNGTSDLLSPLSPRNLRASFRKEDPTTWAFQGEGEEENRIRQRAETWAGSSEKKRGKNVDWENEASGSTGKQNSSLSDSDSDSEWEKEAHKGKVQESDAGKSDQEEKEVAPVPVTIGSDRCVPAGKNLSPGNVRWVQSKTRDRSFSDPVSVLSDEDLTPHDSPASESGEKPNHHKHGRPPSEKGEDSDSPPKTNRTVEKIIKRSPPLPPSRKRLDGSKQDGSNIEQKQGRGQ